MGGKRKADLITADSEFDIVQLPESSTRASSRVISGINRVGAGDPVLSFASLFEPADEPSVSDIIGVMLPAVGTVTERSFSSSGAVLVGQTSSSSSSSWSGRAGLPFIQTTTTTATTSTFKTTTTSTETRVASTTIRQFMKSRVISFSAKGLRPNTRVYPLFDGIAVDGWCLMINTSTGARSTFGSPLITNINGELRGEFLIPNNPAIRFTVGTKIFKVTDNPADDNTATTMAEAEYFSAGAAIYQRQLVTKVTTTSSTTSVSTSTSRRYYDPLAQSFFIDTGEDEAPGMYITSIDVYFKSKAADGRPVTLEIREMVNGYPGPNVVKHGTCVLYPFQVVTSDDSNSRTRFIFPRPVFLDNKTEYCFVLKSDSMGYNAYISRMGEFLLNSTQTMAKQPFLGSMFVSQNDFTWTADQLADLKFVINRAKFVPGASSKLMLGTVWPNKRIAYDTVIETYTGESEVRIFALDHGLRVGTYTTLALELPGGTTRTDVGESEYILNGIRQSNFAGFKKVTYADTYSFVVELNPDGTLTTDINATESGFVDVQSLVFEPNVKYESIKFIGVHDQLTKTDVKAELKGVSYSSVHGNQPEMIGDSQYYELPNFVEVAFPTPRVVTSYATSIKDPKLKGNISTRIATTLSTTSEFVAPIFDLKSSRVVTRSNILDNPTDVDGDFPVLDYVSEIEPDDGIVAARYIVRPINIQNPARAIRVMLAGVWAEENAIDVYYRCVPVGESKDIHEYPWIELPLVTQPSIYSTNPFEFFDFTYEIRNSDLTPVDEFKTFSIKILFRGSNSCIAPKVKDLRILALAN